MHIAQHITTCRSEAARAGSGLSTSQHRRERRSSEEPLAGFGGPPASIANEISAKPGRLRTLAAVGLKRPGRPRKSVARDTPDARVTGHMRRGRIIPLFVYGTTLIIVFVRVWGSTSAFGG